MDQAYILQKIVGQGGFITDAELPALVSYDRLRQCLIRCGARRLTCAAQDVAHYVQMIEASHSDYVRDVSLLSGDPAFRGDFRRLTPGCSSGKIHRQPDSVSG